MRKALALIALLVPAAPAAAETDITLMDLSLGLWMLTAADGRFCPVTLGDGHQPNGRYLDGGGDCRSIDPAMAQATTWRIDEPGELLIMNDGGKVLLKMKFDEPNGTFRTAEGRKPALSLEPSE